MLCAVSCGGGTGVFLSITPPAGTQQVELLVAPSECSEQGSTCAPGISWGSNINPPDGTIFSLDSDQRNLIAVPRAGTFTLQLQVSNVSDGNPDRIALVAFDNQNNPIGLGVLSQPVVPTSDMAALDVTLQPIAELDPVKPAANTWHVWRPLPGRSGMEGDDYPSCVATATSSGVEFYVPSDHDCDNNVPECDDYWYDSISTVHTSCFTTAPPSCVVGTTQCTEGRPSPCNAPTVPPYTCVPDAICQCGSPDSATSCIRGTISDAYGSGGGSGSGSSTLTYADCQFTKDSTSVCGASDTTATAEISFPKNCTSLATVSLYKVSIPLGTPLAVASFGQGSSTSFGSGQATLNLDLDVNACGARLTWVAGSAGSAPPQSLPLLVLDFSPSSNTHILIPLHFTFTTVTGVCDTLAIPPSCGFAGSGSADNVWRCGG
jgi:hypothetical protein